MIIKVKSLGNDAFSRPVLQNVETGHTYADTNLGQGVADWHILTTEGEPLARVAKEVVFEVVETVTCRNCAATVPASEAVRFDATEDAWECKDGFGCNREDHIIFLDGDGERIDCTTVDADASEMREQIRTAPESITVYLTPMNEGQELNYMERFHGTPMQIVGRCHAIILGLQSVLTNGTWSVQVESTHADGSFCGQQSVRIDLDKVFDSDFNVIADISPLGGL